MKLSIHYSGVLRDFFKEHHPEFLETLREMVPTILATLGIWKRGSPVIIREEANTRREKDPGSSYITRFMGQERRR